MLQKSTIVLAGLIVVGCNRSSPRESRVPSATVTSGDGVGHLPITLGTPKLVASLDSDLAYEPGAASDSIVPWMELYYKKLYWYSPTTGRVDSLQLEQGQGPTEIGAIVDLALSASGDILLLDNRNGKILVVDPRGSILSIAVREPGFTKFAVVDSVILFVTTFDEGALLAQTDLEGHRLTNYGLGELDMTGELANPFSKVSRLAVLGGSVVLAPKYRPVLYIFETQSQSLTKEHMYGQLKLEFDVRSRESPSQERWSWFSGQVET